MQWPKTYDDLYKQIHLRFVPFLVIFFLVVTITYAFFFVIDFIPEPIEEDSPKAQDIESLEDMESLQVEREPVEETIIDVAFPLPIKIIFDSLDSEVKVLNPQSRDIADLDEALLSGVVRHPDSANFAEEGNILILGHSSYLPNVFNKNFQAFNGIQNLEWGDTIRMQSQDTEYVYRVQDVYKATASEVEVPYTPGESRLTLATCNSFGSKDDRFVVEAVLIDSYAI